MTGSIETLREPIARAAAGVQFVSEGEAPFVVVALSPDASAERPIGVADVRRRFGIPDAIPVAERTLDDFFSYGIEVDPADAAARAAVPAVRALRDAIRAVAPDARAFRVGAGAEVRYLVVGYARTGPAGTAAAIVGVETVGYES